MSRILKIASLALLILSGSLVNAAEVSALRYWTAPDHTRLVFDVTSAVSHKIFLMSNPQRLVIDLKGAALKTSLSQPEKSHPLLSKIRAAKRGGSNLRVVLDLKVAVQPKTFLLKPNKDYGNRLVIDLYSQKTTVSSAKKFKTAVKPKRVKPSQLRDLVIAIDAGHGGEDPGARGPRGVREKDVVFAIAKKLQMLIKKEPSMRPVMVRSGDYYVGLRDRMKKAREAKADLFISIHADAFRDSSVRGASVYTLSRRGATSEAARWLAKSENAADLVGGVSLGDKDDLLASVLLDLSQSATQDASKKVANEVLKKLKGNGKLHKRHVQQAGFLVLKSPDIPSILVETAFISNPQEERNLKSGRYQTKLAKSILSGVRNFFAKNAPVGTRMAALRHTIARGDTLSHVANRYGVTTKAILAHNSLKSTVVRVGQVIDIPG
jgi:N-acetylmuramoyl-L-alanine amidase